ncbi:uncharacterized protein LOC120888434 isoform X1 [Ictidomys tridecemlineatus]
MWVAILGLVEQEEETLQVWEEKEVLIGWMQVTQCTRSLMLRRTPFPKRSRELQERWAREHFNRGGRDTAGLGRKGGPYRLDAGHTVYQVSEAEDDVVPEEIKRAAREMGQRAFQQSKKSP